jgi:hypothetical protein
MKARGDPPSSLTVVVFLVGAILFLALVLLAQVLFFHVQRSEEQTKVYASTPQELSDLQARQLALINTYRYVSEKDGVVAIPIDRAIERFVAEMKSAPASSTMKASDRLSTTNPAEGHTP